MQGFLIKISIYSLILIVINLALGYYLRTYESVDMAGQGVFFPKERWEAYYAKSEPVDVLVLGSSHAYRSYEPNTMEMALERRVEVFNMGSSAQSPITSYYILEEVLQNQPPKLVIMDIYFMVFTSDELLNNGLMNWNYMKSGPAKWQFFREGLSRQEQLATLLFPTYVYRKYLEPKVKKILGRSYLPPEKGKYLGKGFVGYADTLALNVLQNYNQFDRYQTQLSDFTEKSQEYLLRIARRCRELNIPIVFSVAPIPEISVQKILNYPEISAHFAQLADSVDVPYYDFNRQRLNGLRDEVHYYDDDHMNLAGASYFSREITSILKPFLQNQNN